MTTIYDLADELSNGNEKAVMDLVYQCQVEGKLACDCRECLLDITALALNMLKPRYSVSILKDLYLTEEDLDQHDRDVKQSVTEAIKKVAARPHHY